MGLLEATMSERADAELLTEIAQRGDRDAFSELYDRYLTVSFNLALCITGNHSIADEAVQEGMLRVWKSAKLFKTDNARAWILSIVAREGIRLLKTKWREQRQKEAGLQREQRATAPSSESTEQAELLAALWAVLRELPELERQLISLHFGAGLSQRQISAELELPQQTISFRINKALENLRGNLAKAGFAAAIPLIGAEHIGRALATDAGVPASLKSMTLGQLEKLDAVTASRRVGTPRGKAAGKMWLSLAGGVAVLAVVGTLSWSAFSKPAAVQAIPAVSPAPAVAMTSPTPAVRTWNFNSAEQSRDFKVTFGSWHFVPNGGADGSGCMETVAHGAAFGAETEFAGPLPILLTYDCQPLPPGEHLLSAAWSNVQNYSVFHNAGNVLTSDVGAWFPVKTYISGRTIDTWINGQRASIFYGIPRLNARPALLVRGACRIDNLKVESIRPEDLPDTRAFVEAVEKIAPEKRSGTHDLPELQSTVPGKPVTIQFNE